jgi:hypothetical protein
VRLKINLIFLLNCFEEILILKWENIVFQKCILNSFIKTKKEFSKTKKEFIKTRSYFTKTKGCFNDKYIDKLKELSPEGLIQKTCSILIICKLVFLKQIQK